MRPLYTTKRISDVAIAVARSRALLRRDRWTSQRLHSFERDRVAELVRYAKARSPFYRRHYAGIDTDAVELDRLPVVDKATMMANFDELVTDPQIRLGELEAHLAGATRDEFHLGRYRVMMTGGTTGQKGVVVVNRGEWREHLAGWLRAAEYFGLRPRLPRRVRFATVLAPRPLYASYQMATSLDIGVHDLLRLDAASPVEELIEPLNSHRPDFLYGYPSILALLATEQIEGRLRIAPSTLISSGETHTEEITRTVRSAWDVPWFQIYVTTESLICGVHCSHYTGIHLFEDSTIVEVVDEDNQPVPPGHRGHKLLITNLVNRMQPLIRYAVSDMAAISPDPCPCGRPFRLLTRIEGRSDHILDLPGAEGDRVAIYPLALENAMDAIPGLRQYKIIHDGARIQVRAALRAGSPSEETATAIETGLRQSLISRGAAAPSITVELVDSIEDGRDAAGKYKPIEVRRCAIR